MEHLWKHGSSTSEMVREGLAPVHPMKDATVRTVLRRLETKGYVTHRVDGRTYRYAVAEQPENVAMRAVRRVIERFCGGSVERLLVGMVENDVIDRKELRDLAAKIARARKEDRNE